MSSTNRSKAQFISSAWAAPRTWSTPRSCWACSKRTATRSPTRPRTPKSSSSTPARSSRPPKKSPSRPSSTWPSSSRAASARCWSPRAACRSATQRARAGDARGRSLSAPASTIASPSSRRARQGRCELGAPLPKRCYVDQPAFIHTEKDPRMHTGPDYTGFLKLCEGCNRRCAFCIIPKLAGQRALAHRRVARRRGARRWPSAAFASSTSSRRISPIRHGMEVRRAPRDSFLRRALQSRRHRLDPPALRLPGRVLSDELVDDHRARAQDREVPRHADPAHERSRAQVDEPPADQGQAL